MERKNKGFDEEKEKIYSKIKKEWKLTNNIRKDFLKITIQEFISDNEYEAKLDKQVLFNFSTELLGKILGGVSRHLGDFGETHLYEIMKHWIYQDVNQEIIRRIKKNHKHTDTTTADQSERKLPDKDEPKNEGGMMYL